MLKKIVYWAYLNRVFTGLISGQEHWLHGFGPIWATLLPIFFVLEYRASLLAGLGFKTPWHIIASGVVAIFLAIAAERIEVRRNWTQEFEEASSTQLKVRAALAGLISIVGFISYLGMVVFFS